MNSFQFSSPSNGVNETVTNGYINPNPGDTKYGDIHFYTYTADGWDPKTYHHPLPPRFVSEYGKFSLEGREVFQNHQNIYCMSKCQDLNDSNDRFELQIPIPQM